jgi:hypothetical protein
MVHELFCSTIVLDEITTIRVAFLPCTFDLEVGKANPTRITSPSLLG